MPLLRPQPCVAEPEDVCCTSVFKIAEFILDDVWCALKDCMPSDCQGQPLPLEKYVTIGRGDDGIADAVAVAFLGAGPSAGSGDLVGQQKLVSLYRGSFDVRLRESGWPTLRIGPAGMDAPAPALQQAAALQAYSHGERFFRRLTSLVNRVRTGHWVPGFPTPGFMSVSNLSTLDPAGGIVGFSATVTVDLPWGIAGF